MLSTSRRLIVVTICLLVISVVVAACGSDEGSTSTEAGNEQDVTTEGVQADGSGGTDAAEESFDFEKLVAAAEEEGEVDIVSTLKDEEVAPVIEAFNKEYPNIAVNHSRDHGAAAQERLMRELASDADVPDIVQIHGDYEDIFVKVMDVLASANWEQDYGVIPEIVSGSNRLVAPAAFAYVFAYNNELVDSEEAPQTWEDLLDPKWKGRLIVDTRPNAFLYLAGEWGAEKTVEYAAKLGEQDPIFVRGQTENLGLMGAGEYELAATAYLSSANYVKMQGGPISWNFPNPIPMDWMKLAVLKKADHPNAARLLLGWLGSEGYKEIAKANLGRAIPFGDTEVARQAEQQGVSFPPSMSEMDDRQAFQSDVLEALGVQQ